MTRLCRKMFIGSAALCLCALAAHADTDDDEVKFRARKYRTDKVAPAKIYTPAKQAVDRVYRAKVYKPQAQVWQPTDDASRVKVRPFIQRENQRVPNAPVYVGKPAEASRAYKQQKHVSVLTIPPNPQNLQGKEPLISFPNGSPPDKRYQPPEKPKEKNPLLTPRQGIREIPHDAE